MEARAEEVKEKQDRSKVQLLLHQEDQKEQGQLEQIVPTAPSTHRQSGFDPGWMENPRFKPWLYYTADHGEYHI